MAWLKSRISKGIRYWSIVESVRIGDKVKQVTIEHIGNDKKLGDRFMNLFQNQNLLDNGRLIIKSYSHGDSWSLMKIVNKLGIEQILDDSFTSQTRNGVKRSTSLILAAIHRVCDPGSKMAFESWFERTSLPYHFNIKPDVITSQHFWNQMDGITQEELTKAEDIITTKILDMYAIGLDKLALDYTNYFTYIASDNCKCNTAQRGRNKQKRNDLRQLSLAIVTSKKFNIPLFSHVYAGNKNDQLAFKEYLPILEKRIPNYNHDDLTLIFDGGSGNKENFNNLKTHYICSFSLSRSECKPFYEIDLKDYTEIEVNGKIVKSYRLEKTIWGSKRVCILSFSQKLYDGQLDGLNNDIKKTLEDFQEFNESLKNPKSRIAKDPKEIEAKCKKLVKKKYMSQIIQYAIDGLNVSCTVNEEIKQTIAYKYFGKRMIASDHFDWSTTEIMNEYNSQDCIEKIFRSSKDTSHCAVRPIYHWTDQKVRVHIFICLLGLILISVLQKELDDKKIKISKEKLLDELCGIRECWIKESIDSKKIVRNFEQMNETQQKIWNIISSL